MIDDSMRGIAKCLGAYLDRNVPEYPRASNLLYFCEIKKIVVSGIHRNWRLKITYKHFDVAIIVYYTIAKFHVLFYNCKVFAFPMLSAVGSTLNV